MRRAAICHPGAASSFFERDVGPGFWSDVFGGGANEAVIAALFHNMSCPSGGAGDDEEWSEHRCWNAAEMERGGAVKIEIRKKFFLAPHHGFDALGNGINSFVA